MKTTTTLGNSDGSVIQILSQQYEPSPSKKFPNKISLLYPVATGVFLITTIIFVVLYVIERSTTKCDRTTPVILLNNTDLCLTPYCIKAAENLLEFIDETVDPCENFYQFTCGTWIKNTKIQSGGKVSEFFNVRFEELNKFYVPFIVNKQDIFGQMKKKMNNAIADLLASLPPNRMTEAKAITNARRLYNSCVDEYAMETEGVDAILSLINTEFGGWPILQGSTWNQSMFNFSQLLFKLSQYNNFVFYHIETKINRKNISMYRIRISPSPLNLGYRSFYTEKSRFAKIYRQFIRDLVWALTNSTLMIDADVNAIFYFEKEIAKYHRISDAQSAGINIRTTVKNLSNTINTNFDITGYLRRLYLLGNVTLTDDDMIIVNNIEVIRNISSIIAHQSARVLQNYMIWRFVIYRIPNMPKRFRTILDKLNKAVFGINKEQSRTVTCANYVNMNMGFAVSKLYINKYYDKLARVELIEIVDNVRNTFIDMVYRSTWMDAISKRHTIEKAQAIIEKVGYPAFLDSDNVTKLENIYAEYNFNSSHMKNVLLALQLNVKQNLQKFREAVDRREWIDYIPTTINAFYHSSFNKIVVPAGILQPPYFHKHAPKYLNYGAIGSIVGHEITHGFDELRRHIDKDRKRYTLWSNETIEMFDQRSKCMIEQYNNYTVTQVNLPVNGKRTREENIADNDGLKKAFYAYRKWRETYKIAEKKLSGFTKYSVEQMFFISFGQIWCSKLTDKHAEKQIFSDNHSPSQFRVNGPTSNFAEFDRAFDCKPGQGNSRVNKCNVW